MGILLLFSTLRMNRIPISLTLSIRLCLMKMWMLFKSSMHFFAGIGMIPLGGNTVFVRRALLEQLGGWDEYCLTEDADLGIRLSLAHARIRIIYEDEYVTREETPNTLSQF